MDVESSSSGANVNLGSGGLEVGIGCNGFDRRE